MNRFESRTKPSAIRRRPRRRSSLLGLALGVNKHARQLLSEFVDHDDLSAAMSNGFLLLFLANPCSTLNPLPSCEP